MTFSKVAAVMAIASAAVAFNTAVRAQAFDDRPSTFAPLASFVGIGTDSAAEKDSIDFRERAPLVVPKALDLPPPRPGAASARVANWPQDQDVVRRRDEAARARVPSQIQVNANPVLTKQELMRGRSDEAPIAVTLCDTYTNGAPDCAPTSMEKIKRVFTLGSSDTDTVIIGKEPSREYLTEPPRGYRTATQTTKATREGGYERDDPSDAGKYYRDQAKRNSDYR